VEFGWATGWSLPTAGQWERAARGVDSRRYTWGEEAELGGATTGPEREGPLSPHINRWGYDVSPYGVWCLTGNMSEWVEAPEQLRGTFYDVLKGGNWWHKSVYANLGCVLAVRIGYRGPYAGIRVVKTFAPERP
jgi:formylglycine-generating enzyme required for sulfatase activity